MLELLLKPLGVFTSASGWSCSVASCCRERMRVMCRFTSFRRGRRVIEGEEVIRGRVEHVTEGEQDARRPAPQLGAVALIDAVAEEPDARAVRHRVLGEA